MAINEVSHSYSSSNKSQLVGQVSLNIGVTLHLSTWKDCCRALDPLAYHVLNGLNGRQPSPMKLLQIFRNCYQPKFNYFTEFKRVAYVIWIKQISCGAAVVSSHPFTHFDCCVQLRINFICFNGNHIVIMASYFLLLHWAQTLIKSTR